MFLGWRSRREQVKYGFAVPSMRRFWLRNVLIIVGMMFIAYRLAGYKGLPIVALLAFVLIGVYMFMTLRTVLGRRIYAVGGNAKAAMLSGVNSKRMVFLTFINMGVLAALGGIIIAARFNSATPKAGYGFELDVIAATFVGGASAYGGVGTVAGTVIGALFFGLLNIGMGVMSIPIDYQFMIKALVLLVAVYFDVREQEQGSLSRRPAVRRRTVAMTTVSSSRSRRPSPRAARPASRTRGDTHPGTRARSCSA